METDIYSYMTELNRKTERNRRDIEIVLSHLKSVGLLPDDKPGKGQKVKVLQSPV